MSAPSSASAPATFASAPLSKIGLGTATFGREIDEKASWALMDHALARGVNHFDLAAAYAKGESERITGRWLAARQPKLVLATKALGPYSPENLRASVENSLRSLQVDTLDLFFFHKWDETAADPAVLAALDALVREGKIRALGASNFTLGQFARVQQVQRERGFAQFQALQNNNNYAIRHVDSGYLDYCRQHGVTVFTFSPLGSGFLTGKHETGVVKGSRFDLVPNNQNIYFTDESYRRLHRLEAVAAKTGLSKVTLALFWALHQPVAAVLVGGRTLAHLDQAFDALALGRLDILADLAD